MINNISSNYRSICELFNFSKVEFLSFEELTIEVRKCKFKNENQYVKNRKPNWPCDPKETYRKEWCGWENFLGIKKYTFQELKEEVVKDKFSTAVMYKKNRKFYWPVCPNIVYKKNCQGWEDFLGIKKYTFQKLKKEVVKNKFKSLREYRKNRKKNWPSNPNIIYKNNGWNNWCDFLGNKPRKFLTYKECKKEILKYKFKNKVQYRKNKKPEWPVCPNIVYKKNWQGWNDFLGILNFEQLTNDVKKFKIKNARDYVKNRKNNWPSCPHVVYKNKGWKDWNDFLGKETLQT